MQIYVQAISTYPAGFPIWIETCSNFLSCPMHIFHVTPDCIRVPLLCQSQQLFTSAQMYVITARIPLRALFATRRSLSLAYFFPPHQSFSYPVTQAQYTLTFFSAVSELKGCYAPNRGRWQLQKVLFMCTASDSNLLLIVAICCIHFTVRQMFYISIVVLSIQINLTFPSLLDDVQIMCDVNGTVEAHTGENVTIQCRAFPDVQYKWTKVTVNNEFHFIHPTSRWFDYLWHKNLQCKNIFSQYERYFYAT